MTVTAGSMAGRTELDETDLVEVHDRWRAANYLAVGQIYYASELFREKQIRSVTANTRADGEEFLRLDTTGLPSSVSPLHV